MTLSLLSSALRAVAIVSGLFLTYFWLQWLMAVAAARKEQSDFSIKATFSLAAEPTLFSGRARQHAIRARHNLISAFVCAFVGAFCTVIAGVVAEGAFSEPTFSPQARATIAATLGGVVLGGIAIFLHSCFRAGYDFFHSQERLSNSDGGKAASGKSSNLLRPLNRLLIGMGALLAAFVAAAVLAQHIEWRF